MKRTIVFLFALITLLISVRGEGAVKTSSTSGNWSTGSTWVGGSAPATTDTAIIAAGHTVSLTAPATIRSITVNATGILSGSSHLLTVTGNYAINGTHSGTGGVTLSGAGATMSGTGNVTNTGTMTISASKSISAGSSLTISGVIAISTSVTVTNNGTITSTSSSGMTGAASSAIWVNAANSTLNIAGPLLTTGTLTATANPNTINYNGTTASQTIKGTTYHHLTITKATRVATFGASTTINGNLTVASGILGVNGITLLVNGTTTISGRLTDTLSTTGSKTYVGAVTINSGGSWANPQNENQVFRGGITNNGSFHAGTAGTVTFNTNNQTLSGDSFTFWNLSIANSITVTNKTSVTVANNLAGGNTASTWVNDTSSTLIAGRALLNTGTLNASAPDNTVEYARAGNQTVRAVTYQYLIFSNSGNKNASGSMTVQKDFTVNGSAVFASGNSFTHTFYGNWIINSTAGTWFTFSTANTIVFNAPTPAAATSISGTNTSTIGFNSVTINNAGGFSTPRNFTVTGTMTISSGATFTPASTVTIGGAGTLTGAGTAQVTRTAATADFSSQYTITNTTLTNLTVEYTAAGQVLSALTYGKLKISGSIAGNTNSATVGNVLNVTGTFQSTAGTITMNNGSSITNSGTLTFFNLSAAASASVTSSGAFTVAGALSVGSSGSFVASSPITISGSSISNSGTLTLNDVSVTGTLATSSSFTIAGSLDISGSFTASGGTVTMSGVSKTITGAGTKAFNGLSVTGSVTTAQNFSLAASLSVAGTFSATAGTATITNLVTLSGTANLFNVSLNNGTTLRQATNAVLGIAGTLTLNTGALDVTTNVPNTVRYNGSGAQSVVSSTYHHLIVSNGNTKTASGAITANGDVTIQTGTTFNPGSFTHSIYGNWSNSGSFTAGASTIQFLGGADVTISGTTTFNVLTVNKTTSADIVTLNSSISAATLQMTSGRIETEANSITITSTRTGSGIILGTITRTHSFSNGTAYEFEGQNNTITFASGGGTITSITVTVVDGPVASFPLSGSVNRLYTVSVTGGSYNATMRLHYEDAELNGNSESGISLWRYTGSWVLSGKSANDITNNWVENNSLTDITGDWTLSDDQNIVQWNGSISAAWETAGNWTILQGAPGRPPTSNDLVQLGTIAATNQPTISSSAAARSVTFGSASAITLTFSSGGSLTTGGNISGTWSANATHAIALQHQTLNVGGDLILSDGTSGHDITLSIGRGSASISGSLTQSGNASITFSDTGSIKIGGNFIYSAGAFTAGSGSVQYNGSAAQSVTGGITYNNLVFNKSAGTASMASPVTVNGTMTTLTGGIVLVNNTLSVAGNITIGTGTTLQSGAVTISAGGNWSKSGTFTPGMGTVTLNGSGSQSISASSFNNLTINKSSGTASLSGNIMLDGDLSIASGIFNAGSFMANRNSPGGSFTLAAGATLKVSGSNNFPDNYGTYSIASTSVVEYDGTGAQTIAPVSYGNLTLSNGNANAKSTSGTTTVNGNLTIASGATLDGGANTITVFGNWTTNGAFTPATSSVQLSGASKTITGATTFYSLSIPGSYTAANTITVAGAMDIGGSFDAGATTTTISGDFSNNGTYLSSGVTTFSGTGAQTISLESGFNSSGTVNFNGTVAPTFASTTSPTFTNVNINNSADIAPNTGWIVNGAFIVGAGKQFTGGNNTHTFGGVFTNNGIVTSSGQLTFAPSTNVTITLKGTTFTSTGVVEFGGTGLITLTAAAISYTSIVISNTHASGITPLAAWTIGGSLTIGTGATLNCGAGFNHTIDGDLINNGTLNGATSTITMSGSPGSIQGSGTTTFNNLTITGDITASTDFSITSNFVNNQTFDGTGATVTFTGTGASTISGSTSPTSFDMLTIAKTSATTTLSIHLENVSSLTVSSGVFAIGTRTITQEAGGGTLAIHDGATMQVGGASNFPAFDAYDLTAGSNVEYNGTVTQTVSNLAAYGNLIFSNSGTKNISDDITAGNATVNTGAPVTVGNGITFTVNGNFNNAGALTNNGIVIVGP